MSKRRKQLEAEKKALEEKLSLLGVYMEHEHVTMFWHHVNACQEANCVVCSMWTKNTGFIAQFTGRNTFENWGPA